MSPSYPMPDVIVCIPGITGSVLRKDGRDVWNVSGSAVFNALRTLGGDLKSLKLEEDPIDVDDVDGIQATSVIRDVHLIPGIGHWTQQEAPEVTTGYIIDWLATL